MCRFEQENEEKNEFTFNNKWSLLTRNSLTLKRKMEEKMELAHCEYVPKYADTGMWELWMRIHIVSDTSKDKKRMKEEIFSLTQSRYSSWWQSNAQRKAFKINIWVSLIKCLDVPGYFLGRHLSWNGFKWKTQILQSFNEKLLPVPTNISCWNIEMFGVNLLETLRNFASFTMTLLNVWDYMENISPHRKSGY